MPNKHRLSDEYCISLAYTCNAMPKTQTDETLAVLMRHVYDIGFHEGSIQNTSKIISIDDMTEEQAKGYDFASHELLNALASLLEIKLIGTSAQAKWQECKDGLWALQEKLHGLSK